MEVTQEDVKTLRKFQKELKNYYDLATSIYRVVNRNDYITDSELKKRKQLENEARVRINVSFGVVEQLLYNLMGGKPYLQIPAIPGHRIDVFEAALSANFQSSIKGECLEHAIQKVNIALGKAETISKKRPKVVAQDMQMFFSEELIGEISDIKLRKLCEEFNNIFPNNPNAGALLLRTIFLMTLQKKLGVKAKEDLGPVLAQVISQNTYQDKGVQRILTDLSKIPKTVLDLSHHSHWVLVDMDELRHWSQGVKRIIEKTYCDV